MHCHFTLNLSLLSYQATICQSKVTNSTRITGIGKCDNVLQVSYISEDMKNKKVLLRERKRHTARRVASARYADLSPDGGYPIQSWTGGTPSSLGGGGRYPPS